RELAIIWKTLPDAAVTKTSRHYAHPVTLDRREPYHFDIIDLAGFCQRTSPWASTARAIRGSIWQPYGAEWHHLGAAQA
ncbi:MAG: hypothetical protein FWD63_09135, partial [Propionibacteriaceae bacterium]|nr:hypothetical protein [Propionibacteriaceae bacterium]